MKEEKAEGGKEEEQLTLPSVLELFSGCGEDCDMCGIEARGLMDRGGTGFPGFSRDMQNLKCENRKCFLWSAMGECSSPSVVVIGEGGVCQMWLKHKEQLRRDEEAERGKNNG